MTPVFGLFIMLHCNVISQSFGDHLVFLSTKTSVFMFLTFSIIKGSSGLFIFIFLKEDAISLLFEKEPLNFGRDKSSAAEDMPFPSPMKLPSVLAELWAVQDRRSPFLTCVSQENVGSGSE